MKLINSPLLTDQYEMIMAYSYWQLGMHEQNTVFELTFRRHPFSGNYTIAAGLNRVIEFLSNWQFNDKDIHYLASLLNHKQEPLFSKDFLDYLKNCQFSCDIDAIPEGNLVFPKQPLLRIKGPILQCQLLETALMNLIQFPTLVATNASRVYQASNGGKIVEFGARRAQGPDGALTASRAAYIGGCTGTSNMLAGQTYGIPVYGTQAHSWIMAFENEMLAFEQFAKTQPHNIILLVDTYHTQQGIENAIKLAHSLKAKNLNLTAIRLDSGDLLALSQYARKELDKAGLQDTQIMVSSDLNETSVRKLVEANAPIDLWGVGTSLSTCSESPFLTAAYKLTAIQNGNEWVYKRKISDTPEKSSLPGLHQVRRYYKNEKPIGDVIYEIDQSISKNSFDKTNNFEDLLKPIFRSGKLCYEEPRLEDVRKATLSNVMQFSSTYANEDTYLVELDKRLIEML